ncbi:MAG: spinster family MFS transporter [Sphingobium sp.]
MLVLVYTFNFIDRQIIGILAVPIKAELNLSDAQLGLMGGLAFALFYTGLGIPIAMLADRRDRSWIMTVSLVIWSGMTAICGTVHNFWQLFAARLGVGIGEAGGVAPAYSLISDMYPPHMRARALGAYSFGIPIGSAAGIVFGGVIATLIDWRYAFFIVGLAGVAIAPLFKLAVRDPGRGRYDGAASSNAPKLNEVVSLLLGKPSFWIICVAAACSSMMGYGLFFWLPSYLVRSFGVTLLEASLWYGSILLVGGVAGIWLGGALADRLGTASRSAYALVPAIAFFITIPFYVSGLLANSLGLAIALLLVPTALGLVWLGPVLSAIQHLVPPNMRATASAIFLFVNNLIGIGLGTPAIGWLSDQLTRNFGNEALRYSILAGTGFYVIAGLLLVRASRMLDRDWYTPT